MNDIQIIRRESIPAITTIEEGGVLHRLGELRDFSWSDPLRSFMGGGHGFSASWVRLENQEVLEPHTHPVLSMMVFYAGAGQMIGDLTRALTGDEVVVVPPGRLHGFVGGAPGLSALSIQFGRGLYSTPQAPRVAFSRDEESLTQLREFSEQRAAAFERKPLFELLGGPLLSNAVKHRALLGALRIWLDGIETLLACRYATCNDPTYQPTFRERLVEFVEGSGGKRASRVVSEVTRDSALEAVTSWFSYQMYILDNAEKTAIVCLVVDRVNQILRKYLFPVLGERQTNEVFGPLAEESRGPVTDGLKVIGRAPPSTYSRLEDLVGEAWDMAEAMTDRVAAVALGATSA